MSAFSFFKNKSQVLYLMLTIVVVLFSSWNKLPDHLSYREQAGEAAYQLAITNHQMHLNSRLLNYRATTGYLPIGNEANIFYTAYTTPGKQRPITFVFNGGPGSASIWLHMGSFGPQRVVFKNDKGDASAKGQYANNPYTWLGFTDLVFIDPVSTGYSRATEPASAGQFNSYQADIRSIATFIQLYLQREHREGSPKFLAGESYGAVRAIGLAHYLQQQYHIAFNGLTLISPALNYQVLNFNSGNDSPYSYYLPTFAVTAQYHHKLAPELQQLTPAQLMDKTAAFAQGIYTQFLNQGDAASSALTRQVIDSLSYFTGLPQALLLKVNGRITDSQFSQNLLQADGRSAGIFDSRFTGKAGAADPSENNLRGAFTIAFSQYISQELKYRNNLPYLATSASGDWNYGPDATNRYLDVSATLKKVMTANPNLKINIAAGYYDLATPVGSTNYVVNHLGLAPALKANINLHYYSSGHMVYISASANEHFLANGKNFYDGALKTSEQRELKL